MVFLVLIPEAFQMGGEIALFLSNGNKLQLRKAKPQSEQFQVSLHGLEHLLDFCEFWESPRFILEWPIKISALSFWFVVFWFVFF